MVCQHIMILLRFDHVLSPYSDYLDIELVSLQMSRTIDDGFDRQLFLCLPFAFFLQTLTLDLESLKWQARSYTVSKTSGAFRLLATRGVNFHVPERVRRERER